MVPDEVQLNFSQSSLVPVSNNDKLKSSLNCAHIFFYTLLEYKITGL